MRANNMTTKELGDKILGLFRKVRDFFKDMYNYNGTNTKQT